MNEAVTVGHLADIMSLRFENIDRQMGELIKLQQAQIALQEQSIRLEERQIEDRKKIDGVMNALRDGRIRMEAIEKAQLTTSHSIGFGTKLWWIFFTAIMSGTVSLIVTTTVN